MTHDELSAWASEHEEQILAAVEGDEQAGFCVKCGSQADGNVEPDARRYRCGTCNEFAVYGAEELLLYIPMTDE